MTDESPGIAGKPIRTNYVRARARARVGAEVERMTEEKIGPSLIFLPFSQTERVPRSHARSPRTAPITILSPFSTCGIQRRAVKTGSELGPQLPTFS